MSTTTASEAGTHGSDASLLGSYVAAGTLGMFIWDLVIHLEEERKLFLKQKISLPIVFYFWCSTMIVTVTSIMVSTSILLLFCVRAFYMGRKRVTAALSLSFFLIVGICATQIFYGVIEEDALSRSIHCNCTTPPGRPDTMTIQAAILLWLSNNIAVFVAIAVRLVPDHSRGDVHEWKKLAIIRYTLRGDHLPEFSRTLWLGFQRYTL
ncbi:hypothetical protein VNI00_005153 [Paramarasmius palmivorus]|uniref:Uncharacterized protein n=1 Tax=Paramarasmius palmivorus TaxID=297713 RepID=A0AAW0DEN9_9AGAR